MINQKLKFLERVLSGSFMDSYCGNWNLRSSDFMSFRFCEPGIILLSALVVNEMFWVSKQQIPQLVEYLGITSTLLWFLQWVEISHVDLLLARLCICLPMFLTPRFNVYTVYVNFPFNCKPFYAYIFVNSIVLTLHIAEVFIPLCPYYAFNSFELQNVHCKRCNPAPFFSSAIQIKAFDVASWT